MTKPVSAVGTCYEADMSVSDQVQRQAALPSPATTIKLVEPSLERLPGYVALPTGSILNNKATKTT